MNYLSGFSAATSQTPSLSLLCLSNGHGEDIIAVRILQELQQSNLLNIVALPLVGEGRAYTQLGIPLIGSAKTMPSGGFIYMDGRQLMRDLHGGLLQLTLAQLAVVRSWAKQGGAILAVGDIVPLLFAWLSGANYAFVGTAKSEYYLRDEVGVLPRRSLFERLENWSGSVYLPWERWLISHSRCKAVFPRDSLTAQTLQKWSIPAFDLGNPMMDRLEPVTPLANSDPQLRQSLTILLLPGSRPPEAYANWEQILMAVTELIATFSDHQLLFLAAIAPGLNLEPLCQVLENAGFQKVIVDPPITSVTKQSWEELSNLPLPIPDPNALTFKYKDASLILTQHAYNNCLHLAEVAIAMAGTATEQFIGLGKPAITIPGKGPQFTYAFAEAQSRHLGPSVTLVQHPNQVADAVQSLLNDAKRIQLIAENGLRRMGKPGAAHRIAACLIERFGQSCS
jgi:uncharacterized protein (TIGR03492 family)